MKLAIIALVCMFAFAAIAMSFTYAVTINQRTESNSARSFRILEIDGNQTGNQPNGPIDTPGAPG